MRQCPISVTSENITKPDVFRMFSGGIETEHWLNPFLLGVTFHIENKWLVFIWNTTLGWNGSKWVNCFLYLSFFVSSAGVGRTGVFIALTNLIERIKTEAVVDVYQTVRKMRQQRTAMVQTRVRINHNQS